MFRQNRRRGRQYQGRLPVCLFVERKANAVVAHLFHLVDDVEAVANGTRPFSFRILNVNITSSGVTGWPSDHLAAD
jgi:hypothetical protein